MAPKRTSSDDTSRKPGKPLQYENGVRLDRNSEPWTVEEIADVVQSRIAESPYRAIQKRLKRSCQSMRLKVYHHDREQSKQQKKSHARAAKTTASRAGKGGVEDGHPRGKKHTRTATPETDEGKAALFTALNVPPAPVKAESTLLDMLADAAITVEGAEMAKEESPEVKAKASEHTAAYHTRSMAIASILN